MVTHGIITFCGNSFFKRVNNKVGGVLYWNWIFRFMIEVYLEITLTVLINLVTLYWDSDFPAVTFSNIFSFVFLGIFTGLPIFILIFYLIHINSWEKEKFEQRWGSVIKGVRFDYSARAHGTKWIAIIHPISLLVRRLVFCVTVVLTPNFVWLQLALAFFI